MVWRIEKSKKKIEWNRMVSMSGANGGELKNQPIFQLIKKLANSP